MTPRLLYCSKDYTEHDWRFLRTLAREYHVWFLKTGPIGPPRESRPLPGGVTAVEWVPLADGGAPFFHLDRQVGRFRQLVADLRPALIHAGPIPLGTYLPAQIDFHPWVAVSWGSDLLAEIERDAEWKEQAATALAKADCFLCDADTVRRKAQAIAALPDERILQFPWGVDLSCFAAERREDLRRSLGWNDALVMIVTRPYRIEIALAVFRRAHLADPRWKLVVVGGAVQSRVAQWATEVSLDRHVHAPGQVSHEAIGRYFQNADVYMSCSPADGTSISMLEACASGLPILVAENPSNREWIAEGVNGWLADPDSAAAYAAKIMIAAQLSEAERRRIGHANRALVERRADWTTHAGTLLTTYRGLHNGLSEPANGGGI